MRIAAFILSIVVIGAIDPPLVGAQVTALPKLAQPPEQQAADKAQCEQVARDQTGFDPQEAIASSASPPPPSALSPLRRATQRRQQQEEQKQQQQKMKQKLDSYNKVETACLEGRGYSVSVG